MQLHKVSLLGVLGFFLTLPATPLTLTQGDITLAPFISSIPLISINLPEIPLTHNQTNGGMYSPACHFLTGCQPGEPLNLSSTIHLLYSPMGIPLYHLTLTTPILQFILDQLIYTTTFTTQGIRDSDGEVFQGEGNAEGRFKLTSWGFQVEQISYQFIVGGGELDRRPEPIHNPEPGTVGMIGIGIGVLIWKGWKRG